jgi:uncharacterized repeat protein (TIGR03803 family)
MTAHSWSKLFRRKSARRIRGLGAVYELSPAGGGAWAESILHDFAGPSDGETPFQNPVFDNSGNLYGTTYNGGQTSSCTGCGTVYQLAPMGRGRWRESVVYDFASRPVRLRQQAWRGGRLPAPGRIDDRRERQFLRNDDQGRRRARREAVQLRSGVSAHAVSSTRRGNVTRHIPSGSCHTLLTAQARMSACFSAAPFPVGRPGQNRPLELRSLADGRVMACN